MGLIPGLGRSPEEGHGNPCQYSCLENPMDTGAWWATVHGVAKSQTTEVTAHTHSNSVHMSAPISQFFPLRILIIVTVPRIVAHHRCEMALNHPLVTLVS